LARASNDADLTVSFEHRQQHVAESGDVSIQPEIFEHIVIAQAIATCGRFIE